MNFNLSTHRGKTEDRTLVRYLLGELSEREQNRVEEQIFSGENYMHLLAVEESLVEDYICGQMEANDRLRFETHYLASPSRRLRMETTKRLYEVLGNIRFKAPETQRAEMAVPPAPSKLKERSRRSIRPFAMAFACAALTVGGAWLGIQNHRLRTQTAQLQSEITAMRESQQTMLARADLRAQEHMAELQTAREQAPVTIEPAVAALVPSLTLQPMAVLRDDAGPEMPRLTIPRNAARIQLQLEFPATERHQRLQAVLETVEGQQVLRRTLRPGSPGRANLVLSAQLFATNDYILTLKAPAAGTQSEEIADYQFTIVRK